MQDFITRSSKFVRSPPLLQMKLVLLILYYCLQYLVVYAYMIGLNFYSIA